MVAFPDGGYFDILAYFAKDDSDHIVIQFRRRGNVIVNRSYQWFSDTFILPAFFNVSMNLISQFRTCLSGGYVYCVEEVGIDVDEFEQRGRTSNRYADYDEYELP